MDQPPALLPPDAPMSDALRALALRGEPRHYRKGTLLIEEGDRSDTLYIVLSGSVKAYSTDSRDREITYGTYGPGEYLGEMSLDGGPRSASVITLEPTRCIVVTRRTLREHIAAHPDFAFELLERVIRRARVLTESTRGLALLSVYGRLVKLLNSLATPMPDGTRAIDPRPTHEDIASRVGASREMVSKLMRTLEEGEFIAKGDGLLVIRRKLPARW